jgi:serine/threonine protein kinase
MPSNLDETGNVIAERYLLRARVARGGYGVVYQADDLHTGTPVAVKVARRASARAFNEVQNEAAQLRGIEHPHVVRCHETGQLTDGRGYLVMEWIAGVSLDSLIAESEVSLGEALEIARQTAEVLAALHARRVLHGDIKPRNLIIPTRNGTRRLTDVRILDFGIAREMAARNESGQPCTEFGWHAGTPDYMAPEQLAGRRQTSATDIFALGATLFFMLYRRAPFGDSAYEIPRTELSLPDAPTLLTGPFVARRLTEEVQLPAQPSYPDEVKALLFYMMRRDPRARLQTAIEALDRIRCLAASSPVARASAN